MNDIGVFGDNEYSLDLLGKEYSLEYWKIILNRFGKRIFFRFRYVRFIRNGKVYKKWRFC